MDSNYLINRIFNINKSDESELIHLVQEFQYQNNAIYQQWCKYINSVKSTPFLPISCFKSHRVASTNFEPNIIFESSGTTKTAYSTHLVKDITIYEQSFLNCFKLFYGDIEEYCVIGLLPSYLEKENSSLVYMVNHLIQLSDHTESGFYLHQYQELAHTLQVLNNTQQKVILFGVTYALLDFAEQFPMKLNNTIVMETGGMKGRKKEITKTEVHEILKDKFELNEIHSEYGMTELLSQAYSKGNDRYYCPPWMKVLVRSEEDPFDVKSVGKGIINVIDLANLYSCSFIATDDVGEVFEDGSFTIYGRLDHSDLRGCSLLMIN